MSAKQAKRLRKAAMGLVVSVSEAGKEITSRTLLAQEHRHAAPGAASSIAFDAMHPKERVDDHRRGKLFAITAVNAPNSLRGIIRTLKKGMKKGTIDKLPPPRKTPPVL
jgi:hypothetical protein